MADPARRAPLTVGALATALGFEAEGDLAISVDGARRPDHAGAADLALAMDRRFLSQIAEGGARAAIVPPKTDWRALGLEAAIFAQRARFAMAGVTQTFDAPYAPPIGVHPSAVVDPSAEIAADASIGPLCVIEADARIGSGVRVLGQATIGAGASIGAYGLIHAGVRVGRGVTIGARVIVHPNAVIGADGFSFVTPERGSVESAKATGAVQVGAENRVWARIHSIAAVRIGDDVEIGAATCIDRGTVADTRIGDGVKIDNLVQIGHNVTIGNNCLICGNVGIAGSAALGERVVLGGKAGVADHATLGDDVVVAACSAVAGKLKPRSVVMGAPAIDRGEMTSLLMAFRRLPRVIADVAALKKRFPDIGTSG